MKKKYYGKNYFCQTGFNRGKYRFFPLTGKNLPTLSMAWRDSSMMGHTTNNFSESTIRLFKDIVLGRCKAYNVVTFADFTCTVMEDYYRNRLRALFQARVPKPHLLLESQLRKAAYLDHLSITTADDETFYLFIYLKFSTDI